MFRFALEEAEAGLWLGLAGRLEILEPNIFTSNMALKNSVSTTITGETVDTDWMLRKKIEIKKKI